MLSTRTTRWSAVTALVCVIILAAAWFLLVGPRRSDAAAIDEQRASVEAGNRTLEARIAELERQFGDLPARQEELKAIRKQLPRAAEVPDLVRNLSSLAELAGVTLDSVTPSTARTVSAGVPGVEAAIVAVPVTLQVTGSYVEDTLYLRHLQTRMPRAFLITEVSVTRVSTDSDAAAGGSAAEGSASEGSASEGSGATLPDPGSGLTSEPAATTPAADPPGSPDSDDFDLKITAEVYALVDDPAATSGAASPGAAAPVTPAPTSTAPTSTVPTPTGTPSAGTPTTGTPGATPTS